uniref:YqaJ viral recombinase domain-containing protein n=1 Tax=Acanthochromis polyacanthus TaxID=80966 RepID=A0A3Q1EA30_9TELE
MWPDISFTDIYFYLIDSPGQFTHDSLRAYKSLKAYEYVKSGHMLPIFYYGLDSLYCFLKTKVIPSQRLCDKPHQPWVCVKKSEGTVYCAHKRSRGRSQRNNWDGERETRPDSCLNQCLCLNDCAISPLWYEHRKGRITGTKAHDIYVLKDKTDPKNNVKKVMGYKHYNISNKAAVAWGADNKTRARKQYISSKHAQFKCSTVGLKISEKRPYLAASSDAVIGCVEIKCPYKHRDSDINTACQDKAFCLDKDLKLKRGHRYFTQVQMEVYVHGVAFCDFVIFTKTDMAIIRIDRDETFIEEVLGKCESFFFTHILPELIAAREGCNTKSISFGK